MAAKTRRVEFDNESLINLMIHYSEGELPLNSVLKSLSASQMIPRWICLIIEADEWKDTPYEKAGFGGQQPFLFRYEGKRVMTLQHLQDPIAWSDEGEIEKPKRQ